MNSYKIALSTYDAARPFAVVCDQSVLNPVKGRYATRAQAAARIRALLAK